MRDLGADLSSLLDVQVVKGDSQVQARLERQQAVLRLVTFVKEMRGSARLPAIQSLHEMAASGASTALDVISQHGMVCAAASNRL